MRYLWNTKKALDATVGSQISPHHLPSHVTLRKIAILDHIIFERYLEFWSIQQLLFRKRSPGWKEWNSEGFSISLSLLARALLTLKGITMTFFLMEVPTLWTGLFCTTLRYVLLWSFTDDLVVQEFPSHLRLLLCFVVLKTIWRMYEEHPL